MQNLRQFIRVLRENKEIVDITHPVDPNLEIAEIHRRVSAAQGPALFFHKVKGSSFPVVTNLFGSTKRVELAFPRKPEKVIQDLVENLTRSFPPKIRPLLPLLKMGMKKVKRAAVTERFSENLEDLPLIKSWPEDGGHFITLPLVYTEGEHGANLGMYRIQRYDQKRAGLHFQIQKGGGFHYDWAERNNKPLKVNIFIGGSPALILSAITPLPENVPELLFAGLLQNQKVAILQKKGEYPLLAECEFALVGSAPPHLREEEGPFGDHYGYYSLRHPFPVFHLEKIYHRKDAIYPATVVGKPRQEDFYIGNYLQKLLSPLFPVVMPGIKDLWSYGETGFHCLSAAVVSERYYRECMRLAFRILGEGQLALTKFLLLTDVAVDLSHFSKTLTSILERFTPETDLYIFSNLSLDTLDYTGPKLNRGSRGVMLGIGEKKRDLPTHFAGPGKAFCPGCLLVQEKPDLHQKIFDPWPLIIWVDDIAKTLQNEATLLWTVFTRFDPASDITSRKQEVFHNRLCFFGPIMIDARMKPSYPEVLMPAKETEDLVERQWHNYFPEGMPAGSSRAAHVY